MGSSIGASAAVDLRRVFLQEHCAKRPKRRSASCCCGGGYQGGLCFHGVRLWKKLSTFVGGKHPLKWT